MNITNHWYDLIAEADIDDTAKEELKILVKKCFENKCETCQIIGHTQSNCWLNPAVNARIKNHPMLKLVWWDAKRQDKLKQAEEKDKRDQEAREKIRKNK